MPAFFRAPLEVGLDAVFLAQAGDGLLIFPSDRVWKPFRRSIDGRASAPDKPRQRVLVV